MKRFKTRFFRNLSNRFLLASFFLYRLPTAYFSGLKLLDVDENRASVLVKYRGLSKSRFSSIYFAVLAMAAELASGILAINIIYDINPRISMLVLKINADFRKKAVGKVVFSCTDGGKIRNAVDLAVKTQNPVSVETLSTGVDSHGDVIAEFSLTWTFKQKISF